MGIVCPGGQEVGDWKSGDQMGSGPNASQPRKLPSCRKTKQRKNCEKQTL